MEKPTIPVKLYFGDEAFEWARKLDCEVVLNGYDDKGEEEFFAVKPDDEAEVNTFLELGYSRNDFFVMAPESDDVWPTLKEIVQEGVMLLYADGDLDESFSPFDVDEVFSIPPDHIKTERFEGAYGPLSLDIIKLCLESLVEDGFLRRWGSVHLGQSYELSREQKRALFLSGTPIKLYGGFGIADYVKWEPDTATMRVEGEEVVVRIPLEKVEIKIK